MLIDINEDFKKICSIEGDKLKDFGGRDEFKDVLEANW